VIANFNHFSAPFVNNTFSFPYEPIVRTNQFPYQRNHIIKVVKLGYAGCFSSNPFSKQMMISQNVFPSKTRHKVRVTPVAALPLN
jgi:hypothetical protein